MSMTKLTKDKLEIVALRTELQEFSDLFDLQRKRMTEATSVWQKATGNDCNPDLGELLEWLCRSHKMMVELYEAVRMYGSSGDHFNRAMCSVKYHAKL